MKTALPKGLFPREVPGVGRYILGIFSMAFFWGGRRFQAKTAGDFF